MKSELKTIVPVRLRDEDIRGLAEVVLKKGRTTSEHIRRAIAAYLKKELK